MKKDLWLIFNEKMPEGVVMGKVANMKGGKKMGGGIKNENMYAQHWRAQHCKKSRG